ncbi:hypothetical protein PSTT_13993 [Puccinia striiformis]|uniref:Uncharacterized protein n=1 Tax=Puccinia striiformis TaxID=27350 RepID=A0A2S4UPM5_9BASI|nr:hypothetical protein PSTT_13993 [Puccinia striiformis]
MITNTPRAVTYFSFPAYESHFDNQKEDQEATSATPPVQQMVLLPTQLDTVTGADPVIQRDSCREAETELSLFLAGTSSKMTILRSIKIGSLSLTISSAGDHHRRKNPKRHLEEQAMIVQFTSDLHRTQSKNPRITTDHDFIDRLCANSTYDGLEHTYITNLQIRPSPTISFNGHKLQIKLQLDLI